MLRVWVLLNARDVLWMLRGCLLSTAMKVVTGSGERGAVPDGEILKLLESGWTLGTQPAWAGPAPVSPLPALPRIYPEASLIATPA